MSVHRNPPMPEFDRQKDGNPFAWIVRMAPIVRAERQANDLTVRAFRRAEERAAARPLHAE